MSQTDWSDLRMAESLPTGMATLLLADVEGSTRLWESQSKEMAAAVARLDEVLAEVVAQHQGVRPVEQGEGDSFVVAFARASDAVACALQLQLAPLAPLRLRVGVHTGEVQLRDEGNYMGPTINRTARLRDLAHGGQTVLSGVTYEMVAERLPDGVWVRELGTHPLRDLPRPERVVQLCHPDLCNEFSPLRVSKAVAVHNLPAQLTSFVGRGAQMADVSRLLDEDRLVTLTGAGGAGDPVGGRGCSSIDNSSPRRGVVRRPGADHPCRCRAGCGGARVGPSRSAGSLDRRHADPVHR
jgi:class 3 adenylate cyclase